VRSESRRCFAALNPTRRWRKGDSNSLGPIGSSCRGRYGDAARSMRRPQLQTAGKLIMKRIVSAVALSIVSVVSMDALADPAAGERLAEKWCAECHAIRADRLSPNPASPTFPKLAAEPSITEYSLRALLRSPHETMPHIMFKDDELDDIISYIMSLKPRN
jgi:mono/diheme cytochrome c family protein